MSFRVRVVLMIMFLIVTSTAATAWLTVRQANEQLTRSTPADPDDVAAAVAELADYGLTHGTWDGVDATVRALSARLGQRLRLVTATGTLLIDTDLADGGVARPVLGDPVEVDPRPPFPALDAPTGEARANLGAAIVTGYMAGWPRAACLTRLGVPVRLTHPKLELPLFEPVGDAKRHPECDRTTPNDKIAMQAVYTQSGLCAQRGGEDIGCLRLVFDREIDRAAPERTRLFVGAIDTAPRTISNGSIALAAGAVMLAAALTALLLGRRVVRPISALTVASRRLGSGDLANRVPVTGHDEIADLAREFNRMAASLADSEERQRRLIADVAHELRTPLANLRGYLEGLADGVLRPDPELFASLHEEALLQQRIVDDLQDLALAEAGALAYHRTAVDLTELVEVCRTAHAAVAEAAGVVLTAVASGPAGVVADPDRLRQVLGNLIRNAVAATPPGGRVTLSVGVIDDRAIVQVRDTGRGVAPEDLPHLFDRLWRADRARGGADRSRGGSGLGLAIARQIVTDHGGTIDVTSTVGVGTTVTVSLPGS